MRPGLEPHQQAAAGHAICIHTSYLLRPRRVIIEKYYQRLTLDFDTNKRICEEVAIIQSKRLRNKIAGFTTVSALPGARPHCLPAAVRLRSEPVWHMQCAAAMHALRRCH